MTSHESLIWFFFILSVQLFQYILTLYPLLQCCLFSTTKTTREKKTRWLSFWHLPEGNIDLSKSSDSVLYLWSACSWHFFDRKMKQIPSAAVPSRRERTCCQVNVVVTDTPWEADSGLWTRQQRSSDINQSHIENNRLIWYTSEKDRRRDLRKRIRTCRRYQTWRAIRYQTSPSVDVTCHFTLLTVLIVWHHV